MDGTISRCEHSLKLVIDFGPILIKLFRNVFVLMAEFNRAVR